MRRRASLFCPRAQGGYHTDENRVAAIMSAILPSTTAVAEALGDLPRAVLFPDEAAAVARALGKRRLEFEAGRSLARLALQQLGWPAVPIVPGPNREPTWPAGVVGSITHCQGYCAAAVAREDVLATVGIDAEVNAPLPEDVLRLIARDEERMWIREQANGIFWDRLLFSAKESAFKAWYPLARRWLDFTAASVRFAPEEGTFRATLMSDRLAVHGRELDGFDGRYLVRRDYVLTAVALCHEDERTTATAPHG